MNRRKRFYKSEAVLLLTLIFVVVVTFVLYDVIYHRIGVLIIGGLVCVGVFVFSILRDRQIAFIQKTLADVADAITVITSETKDSSSLAPNPFLINFYAELYKLRDSLKQKENDRQEILNMVDSIASSMELEKVLEKLIPQLIKVTGSTSGAFYLVNQVTNKLEVKHSVGFSKNIYSEFDITLGEGLLGQSVQTRQVQILTNIPDDTVYFLRTFLGKIKPKSVMVVPVVNQDQVVGVLAMAGLYDYTQIHLQMLDMMKYYLGVAVGNGLAFEKTKRLTNELTFQNKLIQELNSDLEQKSQERTLFLNDIVNNLNDYAIFSTSMDGIINMWNKGAEHFLGYKAEDVVGQDINYLKTGIFRQSKIPFILDTVMREHKYMENGWRTRPDGAECFVEITIVAQRNVHNDVIGYTHIIRDLTALKTIEGALFAEKNFSAKILHDENTSGFLILNAEGFIVTLNEKARTLIGLQTSALLGAQLSSFFTNGSELDEKIFEILETAAEENFELTAKNGKKLSLTASPISDSTASIKQICVKLEGN